ncbi:vacuolar protein sorting-associated family 51 protein [Phanerochaete sordida]|uniref:Conserved oligomeric Golgi complex subunit 1 n=1 Tax=Phanerochaete sordida TaxID=48140 RepID=A0A9P3G167_9APHY|nr:vacuolar protein sorting-associated family 51 protein [Phanerochaete sordida]
MARRPSTVSLSSVGSGSGLPKLAQLPPLPGLPSRPSRSLSNGTPPISRKASVNAAQIDFRSGENWDPDDLFTRHTVAEVKVIQQRLRADADAKQEELRLMVGERYRDLLQASTSIISLGHSSNHVLHALGEMRAVTSAIETVESPKLAGPGQGDTQLQSMQSLAAHLKLLLDSPEHLWRLMEKKMYLHAAWLFLLSRVVHRSLLRHSANGEEEGLANLGIDISEQFPLVQRQWEAISQFRSQITHKATLSLREPNLNSSEVCAILFALHLLESRPFAEALNTFLSQRSRSLTTALSRHKERIPNGNGSAPELSRLESRSTDSQTSKAELRDVRQKSKAVLDIVSRTLGSARAVFLGDANEPPLMQRVITHIHAPVPSSSDDLPSEVRVTSQTLLSSLPSSNHFLLLPEAIKGYKPYLDADSLSQEKQARFSSSLVDWFEGARENLRTAMTSWFANLATVRELWETRALCRKSIRTSQGLNAEEKGLLNGTVDAICRARAEQIWKSMLTSTDVAFREHLDSALTELRQPDGLDKLDAQPVRYMLQAPTITFSSHGGKSPSLPFRQYSHSLEQQISGRTPLLQDVLNTVETRIQALRQDLDTMRGQDEDTQMLASQLVEHYCNDADSMCNSICDALQAALDHLQEVSASALCQMVFLARLADELASSSRLLKRIGCSVSATDSFRTRLQALCQSIMERWQGHVIDKALDDYWSYFHGSAVDHKTDDVPERDPARPTVAAVNSVLVLTTSLQQLGGLLDPSRANVRTRRLLEGFATNFLRRLQENSEHPDLAQADVAKDLVFLYVLVTAWPSDDASIGSQLREAATAMSSQDFDSARVAMMSTVTKMQLLFGLLLPSASLEEKTHGQPKAKSPPIEPQSHTAIEVVKPSARFGLLLVGTSHGR